MQSAGIKPAINSAAVTIVEGMCKGARVTGSKGSYKSLHFGFVMILSVIELDVYILVYTPGSKVKPGWPKQIGQVRSKMLWSCHPSSSRGCYTLTPLLTLTFGNQRGFLPQGIYKQFSRFPNLNNDQQVGFPSTLCRAALSKFVFFMSRKDTSI